MQTSWFSPSPWQPAIPRKHLRVKHEFELCAAHSDVKEKQMKAKQQGYPDY